MARIMLHAFPSSLLRARGITRLSCANVPLPYGLQWTLLTSSSPRIALPRKSFAKGCVVSPVNGCIVPIPICGCNAPCRMLTFSGKQ